MSEHALDRTLLLLQRDYFPALTREVLLDTLAEIPVRVSADSLSLSSPAGETALVTSAWVLSAMGLPPALDIPETAVRSAQPPLGGGELEIELQRLAWSARHDAGALTIALGAGAGPPDAFRITGEAMSATITPEPLPWNGAAPFGGLLAAVLVGAQALRLIVDRLAVRTGEAVAPLAPLRGRVALPPLGAGPIDLGEVDVISGGAITNTMLFALMRCRRVTGRLRIFDDDVSELTNGNRYPFVTTAAFDARLPKVELLEALATRAIAIEGRAERFTARRTQLPLAPRVLVGVDDIPARWVAQAHAPGWLHVGATSHFEVMSTAHPRGAPCAGCAHPRDEAQDGPIPTISFVSLLAGVQQAWSLLAHASGRPVPSWYAWPLHLTAPDGMAEIAIGSNPRCPVCAGRARGEIAGVVDG